MDKPVKPDILIETLSRGGVGGGLRLVSQQEFEKHKADFDLQKKLLNLTVGMVGAVLLVCVIAVLGFIFDSWKFHCEVTREFTQTVRELRENEENSRFDGVEGRISKVEIDVREVKRRVKGG